MQQGIECYNSVSNQDDLTAFVLEHSPLIKKIAYHMKCKLPAHIELDDLIQAGLIGLLEARNTFLASEGASFETWAAIKIRGAMIDELRKNTGITRDISQNIKHISKAKSQIANDLESQGMMSSRTVASKMGISEKRYAHMTAEINAWQSVSMTDVDNIEEISCSQLANPFDSLAEEDIQLSVQSVIASLPAREQQILALYYNEQLNFREIADILELTEARISQLHSLALVKIRKKYHYAYDE